VTSLSDLEGEEKEDCGKTETLEKVLQNKERKMKSKFVTCIAVQLTILFSISKGGNERQPVGIEAAKTKRRKTQVDPNGNCKL
jgi:hypothetical protein